jgi:3-hydroxypropanoate dehydrogenase
MRRMFFDGRSFATWQDKPVATEVLLQLYELVALGPTSTNCCPLRIKYVRSDTFREKLLEAAWPGNKPKIEAAPVTAILGMDLDFPETIPRLFAHAPHVKDTYVGKPEFIADTAFRNSSIQVGYFILAARALGLDCGPMSGFDGHRVDRDFWQGTNVRTNILCNLGYGCREDLFPRNPRLDFTEACDFC